MKSEKTTPLSSIAKISIPNVPQIFVDDASSSENSTTNLLNQSHSFTGTGSESHTPIGSPGSGSWGESGESSAVPAGSYFGFGGVDPFAPVDESKLRQRPGRRTPPDRSPLASPSITPSMSPTVTPLGSPSLSPVRGRGEGSSWYSGGLASPRGGRSLTSDVAPQVVLEALDSSEWRDQIRSYIEGQRSSREGSPSRSESKGRRES